MRPRPGKSAERLPEHVLRRRDERSAGMGRILFHSTGVGAERQVTIQQRHSQTCCQWADVAQTAERLTCNQQVAGSTPAVGSRRGIGTTRGPSTVLRTGPSTVLRTGSAIVSRGSSSVGRASAFQAERRGFDSRLPLYCGAFAQVAQSAEHVLGKDEVGGSIPLLGLLNKVAVGRVQMRCARGGEERYPSGQREQTVNLPAYAFGGSNPPLSIMRTLRS